MKGLQLLFQILLLRLGSGSADEAHQYHTKAGRAYEEGCPNSLFSGGKHISIGSSYHGSVPAITTSGWAVVKINDDGSLHKGFGLQAPEPGAQSCRLR